MKIAITGKIGSGKTTMVNYILNEFPELKFKKLSFAGKIKEIATDLFEMDPLNKNRELMIQIGTKIREIDPDIFVKHLIKQTLNNDNYLIDDLRFLNEYKILKDNGWFLIKININSESQKNRLQRTYPDTWESHIKYVLYHQDLWNLPDNYFDIVLNATDDDKNLIIIKNKIIELCKIQ